MENIVGIAITNKKRDLFYIQEKDNSHPNPEFRHNFTFFGGKIDNSESEIFALKRELLEELEEGIANLIYNQSKKIFDSTFYNTKNQICTFSLYEAVLSKKQLLKIAEFPIKEGEKGHLLSRDEITRVQFIPNIKCVLKKYLS